MNLKFLPIGTVCLVENVNKKQMIIGYSKSGYDYVAVSYPMGFESDNKLSYFNHSQVYELYSLGYKNEESRIFNGTLVSAPTGSQEEEEETSSSMNEVKIEKIEEPVTSDSVEEIPTITTALQFDENGVVVSDGNEELSIPIIQENENEAVITSGTDSEVTSLRFDENGIVISDGIESVVKNEEPIPSIDDNKVATYTMEESIRKEETNLKFDENGVVISDGTEVADASTETVNFNENSAEMKEELSFVNNDATIDVSDVVKQIEKTITEVETSEGEEAGGMVEPPKKEKRGLFHFGRK